MPRLSTSARSADHKLVKGLNEGDEAAFAALYDEYAERLYDYALSMSGDAKAAADIVHDTFIDACRRAPRMRDHLHLGAWLYGAARRRCVRRGRPKALFWDREAEFADAPFLAETDDLGLEWPPSEEMHRLLRDAMARLEPVDQEVALLAFRHGLRPARLGAALGLSPRRAAVRVRNARAELETALRDVVLAADRACAAAEEAPAEADAADAGVAVLAAGAPVREAGEAGPPAPAVRQGPAGRVLRMLRGGGDDSPADPETERHAADCLACLRRGRVSPDALLRRAPAPVLPAALRHRVMHTATDPELAGYRADIAARGGPLTPSGLPSQPDVPSPFTRRWLFTGGGMAGALVAALVAAFVMGPGIGSGTLSWPPFRTGPQPSITHESPQERGSGGGGNRSPVPGGGPQARPAQPSPGLRPDQKTTVQPTDPSSPSPTQPTRPPEKTGVLVVNPAKVEMYGTKTAHVSLAAESGPVSWTAMTSSNQLILSETQGGISKGGTMDLTLTLRTALIGLPGQGTLTFTDSEGATHQVKVVWGATLL
ncbi:RNA polymerase sigma factor, sigma-70 family [Actinomadura meyerae]|uniref:RNA polymerase sigma factor, sigma-70 family n=1 Tax=Actinomadura meyerae TaxID=240840 RepID=A0A239N800_9ACTN|nr:sigma-70 family RNA polymerase sigma factor [Actinomadura meyerae]SNT50309.1 RNA polymerase sigma factor, sigma-70 family [Actinomadura meyerae]